MPFLGGVKGAFREFFHHLHGGVLPVRDGCNFAGSIAGVLVHPVDFAVAGGALGVGGFYISHVAGGVGLIEFAVALAFVAAAEGVAV